jgi:hypothetical protein
MTVVKVFKREGISAFGEATMPEFRGLSCDDLECYQQEVAATKDKIY